MDNDNTEPVFTVGTLPKKCYTDPQELLNDIAAALSVPTDNAKVIKGAQGPPGPPGSRGAPGPVGPVGEAVTRNIINVDIPDGSTFVTVAMFEGWQFASYHILYNGVAEHPTEDDYDELGTIVGVGTIVPVYATPQPTTIRVYFTFEGTGVVVPDENHILSITSIQ